MVCEQHTPSVKLKHSLRLYFNFIIFKMFLNYGFTSYNTTTWCLLYLIWEYN